MKILNYLLTTCVLLFASFVVLGAPGSAGATPSVPTISGFSGVCQNLATVSPKVRVGWNGPGTGNHIRIEMRDRATGTSAYSSWRLVHAAVGGGFRDFDAQFERDYQVRARTVSSSGVASAYTAIQSIGAICRPPTPVFNPSTLACSSGSPRINLSHSAGRGSFISYPLERRQKTTSATSYGAWSRIATNPSGLFTDTNIQRGMDYQYRVRTLYTQAAGNNYSTYSEITTTRVAANYCPPAAPTVSASAAALSCVSNTPRITLSWGAVSGTTAYNVERRQKTTSATSYGSWSVVRSSGTSRNFADTNVQRGMDYQYRVRASIGSANSGYSSIASRSIAANYCPPPVVTPTITAPTSTATALACASNSPQITVSWTAGTVSGAVAAVHRVERRSRTIGASYGSWSQVGGVVTPTSTSGTTASPRYSDVDVERGMEYQYRVRHQADSTLGPYSAVATRSIAANYCPIPVPTSITATEACVSNAPQITLSWTAGTSGTHHVEKRFRTAGSGDYSAWQVLDSVTASTLTDTSVERGMDYQYRVRTEANEIHSEYSSVATRTTTDTACMAISEVSITSTNAECSESNAPTIVINWSNAGAGNYQLTRRVTSDEDNGEMPSPGASSEPEVIYSGTATTYTDTAMSQGTNYSYTVRFIPTDNSMLPSTSEASTQTAPSCVQVPSSFSVTAVPTCSTDNKAVVSISWANASGATQYTLYREIDGTAQAIDTKTEEPFTFVDEDVSSDRQVSYFVKASNVAGATDSNKPEVTTSNCQAPLEARVTLELTKSSFEQGEPVFFILHNEGPDAIELRSATSFDIDNASGRVFAPVAAQLVRTMAVGQRDELVWEQVDDSGEQVPLGNYTVTAYYYLDGERQSVEGTFEIIAASQSDEDNGDSDNNGDGNESDTEVEFTIDIQSGDAPLDVTGTITSNCTESITWNWGDGTIMENANTTASHTYTSPGTYTITVSCGDRSATRTVTVTDPNAGNNGNQGDNGNNGNNGDNNNNGDLGGETDGTGETGELDFSLSLNTGTAPFNVTGTIPSSCTENITWNWGDGTVMENANHTESHTYTSPGTYTVTATCGDRIGQKQVVVRSAATDPGSSQPPVTELPETGNPFFNFLRPVWNWVINLF